MQTRDHLFKAIPEWKAQRKILWAEVQEESGGGRAGSRSWTLPTGVAARQY